MPWIILFVVSWILFFLLADKTNLKRNIIGGLTAFTIATIVDWGGTNLDLYKFYNVVIPWFGCSFFYKFGPILTMGVLFAQSIPEQKFMKVLNIIAFSAAFLSMEFLLGQMNCAKYFHWNIIASLMVNLLTFSTLNFIADTFIRNPAHS